MFSSFVIIGAPRSGTNMLRDIISDIPDFGTWPCDEINYIWRHGNVKYPSDRFPPALATNTVISYIQNRFQQLATKQGVKNIVEKTCANSLRVRFVHQVVPEAKYIFLVRNGVDVIASAMKRWAANLDIPYILRKARYVPLADLPYYATRYFANHFHRIISKESRLAFWGPRFDNMYDYLNHCSLEEICAHQWKQCVDFAEQDFATVHDERIIRINYEEFVTNPTIELKRLVRFLGVSITDEQCCKLVENVSSKSVGNGPEYFTEKQLARISTIIHDTQLKYDYSPWQV